MRHYYAYERDNVYCNDLYHFPAVYAFYDKYENLLYIGKTSDLAKRMGQHYVSGHLKQLQYDQVRKVVFHRCNNVADAEILEVVLLTYYKPPFNKRDVGNVPTIINVDDIISSLEWEIYFDDIEFSSKEKTELKRTLFSFPVWSEARKINFLESAYKRYVIRHENDSDEKLRRQFEELFEMVLVTYICDYRNTRDRDAFCKIISEVCLPNVEIKWFEFCKNRMNLDSYSTYGDIYRAFANNYYISKELVEYLSQFRWVVVMSSYKYNEKELDEIDFDDFLF